MQASAKNLKSAAPQEHKQNMSASTTTNNIIEATRDYVKNEVAAYDASHDFFHIDRVHRMALALAQAEGITDATQLEIVQLAALLHDIGDFKYSKSETATREAVQQFLHGTFKYPQDRIDDVQYIIENISFKNELAKQGIVQAVEQDEKQRLLNKMLHIVQDADRLDAIGAIGIARCMCYTGAIKRPIHDPSEKPLVNLSKEEYMKQQKLNKGTAVNHFYEKLFTLRDRIKTASGKKVAEKRHNMMVQYIDQFLEEWECKV